MPRSSDSLPAFIAPQIPVLSAAPSTGSGWTHEIKHDGFRTLLRIDRGKGQAFTRSGVRHATVKDICRTNSGG
jgi:ATP-dependent DNA ligase